MIWKRIILLMPRKKGVPFSVMGKGYNKNDNKEIIIL